MGAPKREESTCWDGGLAAGFGSDPARKRNAYLSKQTCKAQVMHASNLRGYVIT